MFFSINKELLLAQKLYATLLSFLVVAAESIGFASIYPIIGFIEHGMDIQAFPSASPVNEKFVKVLGAFGITVSLVNC